MKIKIPKLNLDNSSKKTLLIVLSISLLLVFVVYPLVSNLVHSPKSIIALYQLNGEITYSGTSSLFSTSYYITPKKIEKIVTKATTDPNIKAVVLTINSPGGSAAASQEIVSLLKKIKVPLIVYCEEMVASGGYYIATPATSIVALPAALVGSIGVISSIPDMSGLWEKLGINFQTVKSGSNKDMYSGNRPMTEEELNKMQELSNEIYRQFLNEVADSRHLEMYKVYDLATGELYTGTKAKELGLIDKIGTKDDAVQIAIELSGATSYKIEDENKGFLESVFNMVVPEEVIKTLTGKLGLRVEYK